MFATTHIKTCGNRTLKGSVNGLLGQSAQQFQRSLHILLWTAMMIVLQAWLPILILLCLGATLFVVFWYGKQIRCIVKLISKVHGFILLKKTFPPVVSEDIEPWDEPSLSRMEVLGNAKKVIWGYWHQGEATLPGFCELAVKSWRVHHPDWNIVILSQDNFMQYISPKDLPSTFHSLKVQHQSDFVRLAVLKRYGGIYLDVSYVLFRALDDIWDQAERTNALYLTSPISVPYGSTKGSFLPLPNNALLIAPNANNPVFTKWQKVMLEYFESPAFDIASMKQHPLLQRVSQLIGHKAFGPVKSHAPYICNLFTLADVIFMDPSLAEYTRQHVYVLPTMQWTFDFIMVDLLTMDPKDIPYKAITETRLDDWLRKFPSGIRLFCRQEHALVDRLRPYGFAMKVSSDLAMYWHEPMEFHASQPTTFGLMLKEAIEPVGPITQAHMEGAYLVKSFVAE